MADPLMNCLLRTGMILNHQFTDWFLPHSLMCFKKKNRIPGFRFEHGQKKTRLERAFFQIAERPGFEPGLPFRVNTLSKRAP